MRVLPKSVVVTAVRNEGPFLLEWIAWYQMLGFENILVMHNDCTDHSPQLLRLLEREGVLVQKNHHPKIGDPPQVAAHITATRHRLVQDASWVFVCDVDEYLIVHTGDRTVSALVNEIDGKGIGMAINWRIFGSSDEVVWRDELVHRRFQRSAHETAGQNSCFKTIFRDPKSFGRLRAHGPNYWQGAAEWGTDDRVFLLADGSAFERYSPVNRAENGTPHDRMTNALAQVNHYAVQTLEQFTHKRTRLSAATLTTRYDDSFFRRFDRNEIENKVADTYAAPFDAAYAKLLSIPGVERLHHLCCADYVTAMCAARGENPQDDPRVAHHMSRAKALPHHKARATPPAATA